MAITNTLRVIKFWTVYRPDGMDEEGKQKFRGLDMVRYGHIGKDAISVCEDYVHRLSCLQELIANSDNNEATQAAHARWAIIGPAYQAWKDGHEVPVSGTPLAAWPGLSPEQAEALRTIGLRTVEQFSDAGDDLSRRIPIPNVRELQKQAKMFLTASDKVAITGELKRRDEVIESQALQLEEMRAIVMDLQRKVDGEEPETKRGKRAAA